MGHTKQEHDAQMKHILEEHEELHVTLDTIREFLEHPRPDPGETGFHRWATGMSKHLVALYDALFRHFRYEEQSEVFDDLEKRYPRASGRIHALKGEHEELLGSLRGLMNEVMEYAAGIAPDDPQLRRRLAEVLSRLQAHENRENELIQRMLYNDLGGGD